MTQEIAEYLALIAALVLVVPGTIAVPVFVLGRAFRATNRQRRSTR